MSASRKSAISVVVSFAALLAVFFGIESGSALAEDTHWGADSIVLAGPDCPGDTHWSVEQQMCVEDTHW